MLFEIFFRSDSVRMGVYPLVTSLADDALCEKIKKETQTRTTRNAVKSTLVSYSTFLIKKIYSVVVS